MAYVKVAENIGWLDELPSHAHLGTKDVARIFCITPASVYQAVKIGRIPPHDLVAYALGRRDVGSRRVFWRVDTIRTEIARRRKLNKSPAQRSTENRTCEIQLKTSFNF